MIVANKTYQASETQKQETTYQASINEGDINDTDDASCSI